MSISDENYVLRRVLNATNPVELNAAAMELSRIRDSSNLEVSLYLQQGEKIYQSFMADGQTKRYLIV